MNTLITMFFLALAVDTYFEFYPVYLVGQWQVTSSGIAIFTFALATAVGIGDFFLVPFISKHLRDIKTVIYFSFLLVIFIGLILFVSNSHYLYFIFFLIGLAIATATTTLVIVVSNSADKNAQGEAMGLALSCRMLGDGIVCLIGGLLIAISFKLPIILSIIFALIALWLLLNLSKKHDMIEPCK